MNANRSAKVILDYRALLVFADFLVAGLVCLGLLYTSAGTGVASPTALIATLILVGLWLDTLFLWGQYTLYPGRPWLVQGFNLGMCMVVGTLVAAGASVLLPNLPPLPVEFYLTATGLMILAALAVRLLALRFLPREMITERYVLLANGTGTREFWRSLTNIGLPPHAEIVGTVSVNGHVVDREFFKVPDLGHFEQLPEVLREHGVRSLILSSDYPLSDAHVRVITQCSENGVRVLSPFSAHEKITHRNPLIYGQSYVEASLVSVQQGKYATRLKRVTDVIVTLALLPLGLVLIGGAALLILFTDGTPVIYRQKRVGKDGRVFQLLKLRTMVRDAEAETGPVWAAEQDPRVTPLGRFLRNTRLDELPQLFNVLRGDMSLVGPRPERPTFVEDFSARVPHYQQRLLVRPGMTGWAQINYHADRDVDDVYEKLRYDLYYLRHLSLALDLQILLGTIGVVFSRRSARGHSLPA